MSTSIDSSAKSTDAWLIQANSAVTPDEATLRALRQHLAPMRLHAAWSTDESRLYVYACADTRRMQTAADAQALGQSLSSACGGLSSLRVSRLERAFDVAGASGGQLPAFHYAVEMDPEAGWGDQLFDWYDTEHMPGLAKVEGCIRATRYLNHDHGPLSLACYDLLMTEALGSPPWLAVRGTEWSSRMRPHFTHTIRTMFGVLPLQHSGA